MTGVIQGCTFPREEALDTFLPQYSDHPLGMEGMYREVRRLADEIPPDHLFLEVGTRMGGSAIAWMHAITRSKHPSRWLWTCDPYGDKKYMGWDNLAYNEEKYRAAMQVLACEASMHEARWYHWRMTSKDFLALWQDGRMTWFADRVATQRPRFGFVYLDGDHLPDVVLEEVRLVWPWLHPQGVIVVDDETFFDSANSRNPENAKLIPVLRKTGEVKENRVWLTKAAIGAARDLVRG